MTHCFKLESLQTATEALMMTAPYRHHYCSLWWESANRSAKLLERIRSVQCKPRTFNSITKYSFLSQISVLRHRNTI